MPLSGHLNPMTALARSMQVRGHEVVFFGLPDAERAVRFAGLRFVPFGEQDYPVGATPAAYAHLARLKGEDVIRYSFQEMHPRRCKTTLEQLPARLRAENVDGLVIDTIHFFAELVAIRLSIPYVHIWNALHIDTSGQTPPCIFGWPYDDSAAAIAKNTEGVKKIRAVSAPVTAIAKDWAESEGLQIDWNEPDATLSKIAVITQTPSEFDFPNASWPAHFHHAGPFKDESGREPVPFPWARLTGAPLIYASMGTLVNGLAGVFRCIVEAVASIEDVQLVLSIGNNIDANVLRPLPASAIVAPRLPQIDLLSRASVCITHAGINTVLEALSFAVPLVAIPVGFDQPGVAARITHHRLGKCLPVGTVTRDNLSGAIRDVLNDPTYARRARWFQDSIGRTNGLELATDLVERSLATAVV
jgi:zeaxanthin glucosyltransferase